MNPHVRNSALLALAALAMLSFGWVGFMASDDGFYAEAAVNWLNHFPFVGDNHWSLRHPFVLAVAASFASFGVGEYSLVLVTTAFFIASVVLAYVWVSRVFGANQALWVGLVLVSTPLFAVSASIPGADITEMFFVLLSLYLFHRAWSDDTVLLFLLAGIAAGLGWLTRETSVGLLLLYGLLFLFGYGGSRSRYLMVAVGFALPAVTEAVLLWMHSGDWLYRLHVDTSQGSHRAAGMMIPDTGNVAASGLLAWFSPFLAVLVNQEFMLLFFLLLPAGIWAWRTDALEVEQQRMLSLLLWLSLCWFVTVGYLIPVRELPRYFDVSAFAAAMVVALWIGVGLRSRRHLLAALVGLALLSANLLAVYVENKDPIIGERELLNWLQDNPGTLYTDPKTYYSARFLLRDAGVLDRAKAGRPAAGGLYLYNPNRVLQDTRPTGYAQEFAPDPGWQEVERLPAPRKLSGIVLESLGLGKYLPAGILRRLDRPTQTLVIYRSTTGAS